MRATIRKTVGCRFTAAPYVSTCLKGSKASLTLLDFIKKRSLANAGLFDGLY